MGDVILKFDDKIVGEMRRLPRIVAETSIGKAVSVEVWRNGKRVRLPVTLGEFPEEDDKLAVAAPAEKPKAAASTELKDLGMTLSTISSELRKRFKLGASVEGVIVTKVDPAGPAAKKRIPAGAIIRKIGPNQKTVTTPEQVREKVEEARKAKQNTILVLIESGGAQRFVALSMSND